MSDATQPPANSNIGPPARESPAPPVGQPQTPPPRKRKRRWLAAVGVLLGLVVVLILLAPTIAGMGFVRSIVSGKVNDQINGTVEIGDYSVGWTTGITASDVKVYDAHKNLILQLNKFTSSLTLLDVMKGNLALGDTTIDVDLTRAEIGEDGQLNYAKLARQAEKHKSESGESAEKHEESEGKPIELPAISGKLTINYKGTVYQNGNALVQIQPSTALIDIPNINQPITDDITLNYSVNNGSVGTIHLAGGTAAVKNGKLDTETPSADEKIDLTNADLKALAAILPMVSPSLKLQTEGIASGTLALRGDGASLISAGGEIDVAKFAASGQPLKGNDRVAIDRIAIPIDLSRTIKDGQPFIEVKHADVLLNGGELGKITVAASAPQDALISAAALVPAVAQRVLLGTEPAAETLSINGEGTATIAADLDVAALASQLPATLGLQSGMQLTQGHLSHRTTIAISKDTAKIDTDTKLPDLQGTTDGRAVRLSPIDMSAGLSAVGGESPDLRDLSVHLSSGFLNASGGGATLSHEKLTGSFDLANLQAQAAQFVDLDALLNPPSKAASQAAGRHVQLAGAGTFDLSTDGNLIKTDGQGTVATSLTIAGIEASGIGTLPPVKLDNLSGTLRGDLHRGTASIDYKNFIAALTIAGITVSNKDAAAPPVLDHETITANLDGDASLPTGNGARTVNFMDMEVKSSSGLFGLLSFSKTADALTISDDGGMLKAEGSVAVAADLKKLDDLAQRFAATSAAPATQPGANGQLQSGQLNGMLRLTRGDQPRTNVTFDGAITNLTLTTAQKPITNETVKLTLHGLVPDDHTPLKADASLDSRFGAIKFQDAIVQLAGSAGPWDMLRHADIDLSVPDLPAAYGLLNAFSPSPTTQATAMLSGHDFGGARIISTALDPPDNETPQEATKRRKRERAARKARDAAEGPLPPLQITGGSMAGKISIHRDVASQTTTLDLTDLVISKLALARGDSKYAFAQDVDFKTSIAVKAAEDVGERSPIDQIQQIQFTQLDGEFSGAKLTMPQALVISDPWEPNQLDAHGAIRLQGVVGEATALLEMLEGSANPAFYGGTYDLSEMIRTGHAAQGRLLSLVGGIDLANFQVLDGNGKAAYTEPSIVIKNDLDYIAGKVIPTTSPTDRARTTDNAIVRSLTLDMPSSHALGFTFAGRVVDPFNKRVILGLGTDPAASLDLTYDLAKLWPMVKPTLPPEIQEKYKDLNVSGVEHRTFTVSGYYPVAGTMAESIRHLNADGGFALDQLVLPQGLTILSEDLPFTMTAGVIHTSASAHPRTLGADTTQPFVANTAVCNRGAVDLSDLSLDLGQPSPVLTLPPNHKLLQRVRLNPVLAGTLGAGNLLFNDATKARGLVDVTVVQCDAVPLGDLITSASASNLSITYSVSDLFLDGPIPRLISQYKLGGKGLHGGIEDGKLSLTNGEVQNDFTLNIIQFVKPTPVAGQTDDGGTASTAPSNVDTSQMVPVNIPVQFTGGVILATGKLDHFVINVPPQLLPSGLDSAFPNGLSVPITGSTDHPKMDLKRAGLMDGSGGGLGGLLNGVMGGQNK